VDLACEELQHSIACPNHFDGQGDRGGGRRPRGHCRTGTCRHRERGDGRKDTSTSRVTHRHDATVRVIVIAFLLAIVGFVGSGFEPDPARACVGRRLDLSKVVRLSNGAIYSGRVVRADPADTFWIDLVVDVDRVVRGPADSRIPRAQAGNVCDGIRVGEYGYVVHDVPDPAFPNGDRFEVFIESSRADARSVLIAAGLPDTSTGTDANPPRSAPMLPVVLGVAFVASLVTLRRRVVGHVP
jgi:hypothetical protein